RRLNDATLSTCLKGVQRHDDEEVDRRGHQHERDECVQERAVSHYCASWCRPGELAEVRNADESEQRCQDVLREAGDDSSESGANDNRNCQFDDVSPQDEVPEPAQHGKPPPNHSARYAARTMRLATWNGNSLKARLDRVLAWAAAKQPDIFCMQETKLSDELVPLL